jgi:O-antigen/teichoic acid export membrane protein
MPTNETVACDRVSESPSIVCLIAPYNADMQSDATAIIESQTGTELLELEVPSPPPPSVPSWFAQSTLKKWAPILVKFAFVQALVQVLGFAAGLLIVRSLPKREYAFYTIGNTMLGAILVLADSGISSALTAIGGRVWQDSRRLGSLLNTALQLRRALAGVTLLAVVPVLVWLLAQNGASRTTIVVLAAAVLAGAGLELVTRIYAVALRLRSEIRQIQNQALVSALAKLAIVGIALFVFINATIAIMSVVIGYAVQFEMLRRWVRREVDRGAPPDPAMRSEIVSVLKKQAPHSIYYCLQGQITVWLISVFGNADSVANVGALGRLAVFFALLSSITAEVVLPAFARIQSAHQLRRRYFEIVAGYFGIAVLTVAVVAIFPQQVLSVLGRQYSGLHAEGILMAVCAVVSTTAGLLWAINSSRAWIVPPALLIPCTITVQAVLVAFLDLSTVRGVLLFTMYSWGPSILLSVWLAMTKMWRTPAVA